MIKVSSIIITCGRYPDHKHLLEESVESFLRQTYENRELVILNDCAVQKLIFKHPLVTVVNTPRRFNSLGEKYNAAFAMTDGDLLCYCDDDDLWLPNHIQTGVERIGDHAYRNPRHGFFMAGNVLHKGHSQGYLHNASMFTRKAFNAVGGYPHVSGNQDAVMDGLLRGLGDTVDDLGTPPEQWTAVYRWSVSPIHLSGASDSNSAYKSYGNRLFQSGAYDIKPRWQHPYDELCRKCASQVEPVTL